MTFYAPNRTLRPSQIRTDLLASDRVLRQRMHKRLIRATAVGLVLGVAVFIGGLFAYTPTAPPARVLGVDERLVGIPLNCDVARAARIAPMARGTGYYADYLDPNQNGWACEPRILGIFERE